MTSIPESPSRSASSGGRLIIATLVAALGLLILGPASCVVRSELQNHERDLVLQEKGKTLRGMVLRSRGSGSALLVGAGWSEVQVMDPSGAAKTYRVPVTLPEGSRVELLHAAQEGWSDRAEDVRSRLAAWPLSRGNILISLYVGVPLLGLAVVWRWKRRRVPSPAVRRPPRPNRTAE